MLNNIKSKIILNIIFDKLKRQIKLKILKYNKFLQNRLYININDFHDFHFIKELNKKFNLNIQDDYVAIINLEYKKLGNEILDYFNKIEFKKLKELNLSGNNLLDINKLGKVKLENLKILDLGGNQIKDINILENVNFKELKELYLHNNQISNINILEKVKFEKLEILNLSNNNITNIDIFEKVNFIHLKKLNLFFNSISDISSLLNAKFIKLKILCITQNNLNDRKNILEKLMVHFKNLRILDSFEVKKNDDYFDFVYENEHAFDNIPNVCCGHVFDNDYDFDDEE